MATYLARNRSAFSLLQVHGRQASNRSLTCELKCTCASCRRFFRKPFVRAVFTSLVVSGLVATILIVFCAIQYNIPGDALINFLEGKQGGLGEREPTQAPSCTYEVTPTFSPSEPKATVVCPCFQLDSLLESIESPTTEIEKYKSCGKVPNRQSIYFSKLKLGFQINDSEVGYIVDMRGERDTCTIVKGNQKSTIPIAEEQGEVCLSALDRVCEKAEEIVNQNSGKQSRDQDLGRQSREEQSPSCSCFSFDDLTRPRNFYYFDEKKSSCQMDSNPMTREIFYSRTIYGSLRGGKDSYGFSVMVDDNNAMCIGRDGEVVPISNQEGSRCFELMNDACSDLVQ